MSNDAVPENSQSEQPKPARRHQHTHQRCAICGNAPRQPMPFGLVLPALATMMVAEHPDLSAESLICRDHGTAYRTRYVEDMLEREQGELNELERDVVEVWRASRRSPKRRGSLGGQAQHR